MDPQILSGPRYGVYLKRLDRYRSANVDVLEIYHFEDAEPQITSASLDNVQLQSWIDASNGISTDQQCRKAVGGLRLILGPSTQHVSPEDLPPAFPHGMECFNQKPLPFSRQILENIIEKFNLPAVTPWLLTTRLSHFQRHSIRCSQSPASIGYTMRRSARGILAMNISLSLSHNPITCMTYGLLLGCSDIQQAFIYEQIKTLATLANHPLLLPVLFSAHQHQLLNRERKRLWVSLLKVETESGQTGVPVINSNIFQKESKDYGRITKHVLGIIQVASAWESYSKALILGVDSIQENIIYLNDLTTEPRKATINAAATVLTEWLTSVRHKSDVMLWDFEFIDKRAHAQMTAVHSYIAQRDAQLSQKLSEYSTVLAADSREIAAASKRDSSAMKGIAFLTMFFLPGTYIATFFAMPLLDFSTPIPKSKPGYWIYWAVTAPLTISVLAIYLTYLTLISRKNREEDKKAREDVTVNKALIPHPLNGQTKPPNEHHGNLSLFSSTLRGTTFKKSTKGPEPNPELGMSNGGELTQSPLNDKTEKSSENTRRVTIVRQPTYMPSDSDTEEGVVETVGRPPHIRDVLIQMENPPGITRHRTFQPQKAGASSDSNIDEDRVEIVGTLSAVRDVPEGPQCYLNKEKSYSMTRPARGLSGTINATTPGRTRSTERYDLDLDSDSSYGL